VCLCGDWWRVVFRGKGSKCMVLEVEGDVIVFLYILHGVFERVCADTRMAMQISTCRGFFFIIG